jgi:hypothetical protein
MKPRVFVRLDWKELTNDKRSSLLRKTVIYGQKSFITLGPDGFVLKNSSFFLILFSEWSKVCESNPEVILLWAVHKH